MRKAIQQFFVVVALLLWCGGAIAQNRVISGVVFDAVNKTSVPGVYIVISPVYDSTKVIGTATDVNGRFQLTVNRAGEYQLKATYIGYADFIRNIDLSGLTTVLDTIKLQQSSTKLKTAVVNAEKPPVEQKGDTLQFNAEAFKTNPDATAEDLLQKMPGVTSSNGTVTSNGEQVVQVLVDGKPFFGDDPTLALKNLPAEVIDNIQVYDKLSDQAEFTGFDDGNQQKTINITTKKGKSNGEFGKFYAGYGTDERYIAGGNLNIFDGDRRISILELSNNINQQNFASQDLLGLTGGGGGRGGLGGQGGGGGSSANNFLVGQQAGVSTTNSAGLNYSDVWGKKKKVKITGSYFFNNSNLIDSTNENRIYSAPKGLDYQENDHSQTKNYNHRVNFRLEYTIDSSNSLIWVPKFNFQRNDATSTTAGANDSLTAAGVKDTLSSTNVSNPSNNKGYDFSNSLTLRHKFKKKGRTISLGISTDLNNKDGNSSMISSTNYTGEGGTDSLLNQQTIQNTNGYTVGANLAYTEPAGKHGQVMLNYGPTYTRNNTDKETSNYDSTAKEYSLLDIPLSNKFNSNYLANKGGAGYRFSYKKLNFMVSFNYQYATLTGQETYPTSYQVNRAFSTPLPLVTMNYKFSKTKNLRIMYRASSSVPSITQLQNVVNNSNPLQLSTGNDSLKQDYSQTINLRYTSTNTDKGTSFFVFASGNNDRYYISNATYFYPTKDTAVDGITLKKGTQLTLPVNLNGYWNAKTSVTFGKLIKKIKCNLNLTTGYSYTLNPGIINGVVNKASSHNISEAVVLSSNISEKIDFTLSTAPNYSIVRNSLQTQTEANSNYFSLVSTAKFNWLFWKGFVFNTSISHTYYTGLAAGYNQSYFLWNAALGYKFLKDKSLEVKVTVFDILGQNTSISRTVTETYIQDTKTNVLTRYAMLMVTYTLRKFKAGSSMPTDPGQDRQRWQRMGPPPPDGGGGGGMGPPPGGGPPPDGG